MEGKCRRLNLLQTQETKEATLFQTVLISTHCSPDLQDVLTLKFLVANCPDKK